MGHTPVQPGCAAPAWLRHMSHHAPQGVSPMAQKIRVCGINMAKLVLPSGCCTALPAAPMLPRTGIGPTASAIQTYLHPAVGKHPVAVWSWKPPRRVVRASA